MIDVLLHLKGALRIGQALVAAATLGASGVLLAAPTPYTIDPTHTFVIWEVKHFGTSTSRGRFGVASGTITIDWDAASGEADILINVSEPDTGVPELDKILKSDSYFATDAYPQARFSAHDFRIADHKVVSVSGELTLRDKTVAVTLTSTGFNCYFNPLVGRRVCGGDFETSLERSDFGIKAGLPFVADSVHLLIQIEAKAGAEKDAKPGGFHGEKDDM
jgi:polyisoprenoid-binding protein YceI